MDPQLLQVALQARTKALPELRPEEAAALILARRAARTDIRTYLLWISDLLCNDGPYVISPEHDEIIEELKAIEDGSLRRMVISAPPRFGKSILLIAFLSWVWGRHSGWPLALASYGDTLANAHSRKLREILRSPQFLEIFPNFRLDPTSQALDEMRTMDGGVFYSVGRGTGFTGKGFKIGIADDLIKDSQEAESKTTKDAAWVWYRSTFASRETPPGRGGIVLCATRWAVDDPSGQVLRLSALGKESGDVYKHLHFKALDYDKDGNEVATWPYTVESAHEARIRSGPRIWRSLYQNSPTLDESAFFRPEWFASRFAPSDLPPNSRLVVSSDYAISPDSGDYTVHIVAAVVANANTMVDEVYLIDLWRKQTTFEDGTSALIQMLQKHRDVSILVAEADNIILTGGAYLSDRLRASGLNPHVVKLPRTGSKTAKAGPLQGMAEAGRIWLPVAAPWVDEFISECVYFDGEGSNHDDQVDAAANIVRGILAGRIKPRLNAPGQRPHLYDASKPMGGNVELGPPNDRSMVANLVSDRRI